MYTDDFESDYAALKSGGVTISEEARDEYYGRVAVFKDLYGNRVDLIQPNTETSESISVGPDLTLQRVHARFSDQLFELVSEQREYLSEFCRGPSPYGLEMTLARFLLAFGQEMRA